MQKTLEKMNVLVVCLLAAVSVISAKSASECRPRTAEQFRQQLLLTLTSYNVLYKPHSNHINESSITDEIPLYGNTSCNVDETQSQVQSRSLCPWYQVINYDANRYPAE